MSEYMEKPNRDPKRTLLTGVSVAVGVIVVVLILFFGRGINAQKDYAFENGKNISVENAIAEYEETGSNEALYDVLIGLCYRLKQNESGDDIALIRQYGTEMYDKVKAGNLDLQKINEDQEQTMAMVDMVNSFGITP